MVLSIYAGLCSSLVEKMEPQIELINDIIAPHTRSLWSHTKTHAYSLASLPHAHFSSYSHSRDTKGQRAHTKRMSSLLKPYSPSTETAAIYHRAVRQWLSYNRPRSNSTDHTPQLKEWQLLPMGPSHGDCLDTGEPMQAANRPTTIPGSSDPTRQQNP